VLPTALIALAFLWLNKDLGSSPKTNSVDAPVPWIRSAFAGLSSLSFLTLLSFLGESVYWSQVRSIRQVEEIQNRQSERDRMIIDEVKAAGPEKDFGSLLNQTSRFETPNIRKLAVEKVLSNSNFAPLLITHLRNPLYCEAALIFLRDNDPPDLTQFPEPIRDAFVLVAQNVRSLMHTEVVIHADSFVYQTGTVVAVADRYYLVSESIISRRSANCAPHWTNPEARRSISKPEGRWMSGTRRKVSSPGRRISAIRARHCEDTVLAAARLRCQRGRLSWGLDLRLPGRGRY
jgi:hypothetical protein